MCSLFSNLTPHESMIGLFSARPSEPPDAAPSKRAVFPRNRAAIVAASNSSEREVRYLHWGFLLPQASKRTGRPIKPKAVVNARGEKIGTSPFWRDSFRYRRCLVPATAYCETRGRGPAVYHWFGIADEAGRPAPFAFAGLWQIFHGDHYRAGGAQSAFAVVTTEPNEFTAQYHNRMPLILNAEKYEQWLSGTEAEAAELLKPRDVGGLFEIAGGEGLKFCPDEDGMLV